MTKYVTIIKNREKKQMLRLVFHCVFLKHELVIGPTWRTGGIGRLTSFNFGFKFIFFEISMTVMSMGLFNKD